MTFADEILDRLAPRQAWVSDWLDVLERAGVRRPARLVTKRRLIIVVAVLAAVLVPLAALAAGAAKDWWFLRFGDAPAPAKTPVVVKEGHWDGHPWQLIAYPSTTDGLCFSVTPKQSTESGEGGAMSCGPFAGVARPSETKGSPDMTITFLSGAADRELPGYIAGPVIPQARTVEIRFTNGEVLRVPTFVGPEPLQHIRFYATQLPAGQTPRRFPAFLSWIAGLDRDGNVVACLAPPTAKDGRSPLSDCR
jgi:hypothetical protein